MKRLIYIAALMAGSTCMAVTPVANDRSEAYRQREQQIKDSLQQIKTLADNGDAKSQCRVGNWFYTGTHVPQDYARAFEYYSRAALGGDNTAIGNLGLCYQYGNGVPADSLNAVIHYSQSLQKGNQRLLDALSARADKGDVMAQVVVGREYAKGKTKDLAKATKYLTKAANTGSADGMRELGMVLLNGKKGAEAFKWFEKAAAKGDVPSTFWCGRMLREGGMGVKADPELGIAYLLRASEADFPAADYQLGQAYSIGLGVGKNEEKAREYYNRAVTEGFSVAALPLARSYACTEPVDFLRATELMEFAVPAHSKAIQRLFEQSDTTLVGTPFHTFLLGMDAYDRKDFSGAEKLFKTLDKKKIVSAKTLLAELLLSPDNAKRNAKKGAKGMAEAWKSGDPRAAYVLGALYEVGEGVDADPAKAMEYYLAAAQAGDRDAMNRLGDIYYEGLLGNARDLNKAVAWYTAAGPWRSAEATKRLADCRRNGEGGLPVDVREAARIENLRNQRSINDLIQLMPRQ